MFQGQNIFNIYLFRKIISILKSHKKKKKKNTTKQNKQTLIKCVGLSQRIKKNAETPINQNLIYRVL